MIATHRVKAYMLRHIYEISATFDRKLDIIFWPTIDLLVFGLLSAYIQKMNARAGLAGAIVGGLILWTLIYNIQRDISVSLLEDTWSRNLYNLFSTPLRAGEMILGTLTLSVLKALVTVSFIAFLAWGLFGFNLWSFGPVIVFYLLNIFIFGWAFGCMTAFLIFRFGTRVQIFAWSLIALLYPISGVFYPLTILPFPLADLARVLPISYVFEGLRAIILSHQFPDAGTLVLIFGLNLVYLALGIWLFFKGFRSAKARGWFIHPT
jgi:ABC-2 type transport system permease protein